MRARRADARLTRNVIDRRAFLAACVLGSGPFAYSASGWRERQFGQFHVRSDHTIADESPLWDELRTLPMDLESALPLKIAERPIEVRFFKSRSAYKSHLKLRAPESLDRRALFVNGDNQGWIYLYRHRKCAIDLRHEATHALLHAALPFLPMWLDEGLAEYFEVERPLRRRHNPHHDRVIWSMRLGWKPRLERLEKLSRLEEFDATDYREAWAWTHLLLHGPMQVRRVLQDYLQAIVDGDVPGRLSKFRSIDRRTLSNTFRRHFRDSM